MNIPASLKYTKDHEWIVVDGEIAKIGITDFAQRELGDIVYIDVDTLDNEVNKDEVFGSIEAVKTVSDLFMPVKATVTEINTLLEDAPELVNTDCYGDGWIIKAKVADLSEMDTLLNAEEYKALIGF